MANPRQPASTSAAQPVLGPAASIPKRRPFWPLWVVGLLTLLMVLTLLLRTWALNSTPPGPVSYTNLTLPTSDLV